MGLLARLKEHLNNSRTKETEKQFYDQLEHDKSMEEQRAKVQQDYERALAEQKFINQQRNLAKVREENRQYYVQQEREKKPLYRIIRKVQSYANSPTGQIIQQNLRRKYTQFQKARKPANALGIPYSRMKRRGRGGRFRPQKMVMRQVQQRPVMPQYPKDNSDILF